MDYDVAGNMTAKRTLSPSDTTILLRRDSLFWSALGLLDSVRTRDGGGTLIGRVVFGYDGWSRRVRKSTQSGTNRYVWDGDSLLAQLDTLGNAIAVYTYYTGIDNVASVLRHDRADSTYYYLQDYSGNVLALLARTASGNVIDNTYRYDPFGNLQSSGSNPVPNTLRFAGREYDTEVQLYYDRARYLDPTLGRFVSEDPIGLNGGTNLYAYAQNDPVDASDPTGTKCYVHFTHDNGSFAWDNLAEHLAIGAWLSGWIPILRPGLDPESAVDWSFLIGVIHEGPWWDRDLTDPKKGAPCQGIKDVATFMLIPVINAILQHESLSDIFGNLFGGIFGFGGAPRTVLCSTGLGGTFSGGIQTPGPIRIPVLGPGYGGPGIGPNWGFPPTCP